MAKGKIAHDEQFLFWPQCFQLHFTIKLSFIEIFQVFRFSSLCFQSCLLQICCKLERVKNICTNIGEKSINHLNGVAKGEIANDEWFLLLP